MALTVEDGTGVADADSYLSLAAADTYHSDRSQSDWTGTDAAKEGALRRASTYLDTRWRFKGAQESSAQGLEWPRTGVVDWSGHDVSGLPTRVKHACAELAVRALTTNLYEDLDRGGAVKSESVGSISTTYMDDAPRHRVYEIAERLLAPYLTGGDPPQVSWAEPSAAAAFSLGMNSND